MSLIQNKKIIIAIALLTMTADLLTKTLTFDYLAGHTKDIVEVFSFFNLVKAWNYGISFGMFQTPLYGKFIFPLMSVIIIIILLWQTKSMEYKSQFVATGMIIGGALGNSIDRIINGAVADFLDFHLFNCHWPAFNLADSFICIGVFILLLCELCGIKKNKEIIN